MFLMDAPNQFDPKKLQLDNSDVESMAYDSDGDSIPGLVARERTYDDDSDGKEDSNENMNNTKEPAL